MSDCKQIRIYFAFFFIFFGTKIACRFYANCQAQKKSFFRIILSFFSCNYGKDSLLYIYD